MTDHRQPDAAPPGWQEAFLDHLRATGNVSAAARAAADARTDDKIGRVTGRIDDLADDVTAETAARTAGDAEVKRGLEPRLVNDRAEFKQALQRESATRTAGIDAEKNARTAEMDAERTARTRAVTEGDRAVKAEMGAELTTRIAATEARIGARIKQEISKLHSAIEASKRQGNEIEGRISGRILREVGRLDSSIRAVRDHIPQHYHDIGKYQVMKVNAGFEPRYLTGAAREEQLSRDRQAEEARAWARQVAQGGTCVPGHTEIVIADGTSKPISEIEVGEVIMGRTDRNKVLAFDRLRLGHHRNPILFCINGDYANTDDHLTLIDRGWAVLDPDAYRAYQGKALDCVYLGDMTPVEMVFDGIDADRVVKYGVGDSIAFGHDGYRQITSIEPVETDLDTIVYSLVCDGDGTMQVAGGYVLSAWVSDAKWNNRHQTG